MKDIAGIQNAIAVCQEQKTVHDKYLKIGWKKKQAAFAENHQEELKAYNKAYRYLKAQHVDLNVNLDALEAEYSKLQTDHAGQRAALSNSERLCCRLLVPPGGSQQRQPASFSSRSSGTCHGRFFAPGKPQWHSESRQYPSSASQPFAFRYGPGWLFASR